ncbi:MAG TPA: hypothetical protein EYQ61_10970 [Dehalococcoidia bacterium]|jgi:ABC-type multidrug transport system permease subunit|nr:hypothetical protein [Dehalococcoidia bacterium]HIK88401.1 hypothetical protein [Dehalococcoidia bacterium]
MTTAENIAQIKDIVLIVFLVFSFAVLLFGVILSLRLYHRASSFMDRMEQVATGFEETFGRVAIARKAIEDAAAVLKPVATGLGIVGMFQGFGRMFGSKSPEKSESNGDSD